MRFTNILKTTWIKYNPIAKHRRNSMRKALKNADITLLCPNCLGGILFHDLGLKFNSPTINIMIKQPEFLKFVLSLDKYIESDLYFFKHEQYKFPCAYLKANGLVDIPLYFTHYHSEEEASQKWNSRKKRINKENLFIFIQERDQITEEELRQLGKLNVRGIVAFTAHNYKDIPYSVFLKKYHKDGEVGNILARNYLDDSREYEKEFDFVKWFNEANGNDYDVKQFIK